MNSIKNTNSENLINDKHKKAMSSQVSSYGFLPNKKEVLKYTLSNSSGMAVSIITYGATVTNLWVPDRTGVFQDIVLGHLSFNEYIKNAGYLGATIGRNAGRISKGELVINNTTYSLDKNDSENNLHGGNNSLSFQLFNAGVKELEDEISLTLTCKIKDMEDGFPGNMDVKVKYTLTESNQLTIDYFAKSDADTIVNLTNHSYFNLAGHGSGTIYDHVLFINANSYTPVHANGIPTGSILPVKNTPLDFTSPVPIKKNIAVSFPQIDPFEGFDNNFVLKGEGFREAASLYLPQNGRKLTIYTDRPGVQFYTGNFLPEQPQYKNHVQYKKHFGLCLETQALPDAPHNHWYPSVLLNKDKLWSSKTTFAFSVE